MQTNAPPKMSKEDKIKEALDFKVSSDSDDSDEELEKLLAQTAASKNKKAGVTAGAAAGSNLKNEKAGKEAGEGSALKDLTQNFTL